MPASRLLHYDVQRLYNHRQVLMDLLYVEMEEHSRKLETYSNMFEMTQTNLDVDKEFMKAMQAIGRCEKIDAQQFVQDKARSLDRRVTGGNSARSGRSGGRSSRDPSPR